MKTRVLVVLAVAALCAGAMAGPKATWHPAEKLDRAVAGAKKLGRPIAIMLQDSQSTCPLHNSQRSRWKSNSMFRYFVCVIAESKGERPPVLTALERAAAGKQGKFIPRIYLGTPEGDLLGVIPYKTPDADAAKLVRAALKKNGPMMSRAKALGLWKKLVKARKLWGDEKYAAAVACYSEIKAKAKTNPGLSVFKELAKDEKLINDKGKELIAKARQLAKDGQPDEAKALLTKLCRAFKSFDVAKECRAALAEIEGGGSGEAKKVEMVAE